MLEEMEALDVKVTLVCMLFHLRGSLGVLEPLELELHTGETGTESCFVLFCEPTCKLQTHVTLIASEATCMSAIRNKP